MIRLNKLQSGPRLKPERPRGLFDGCDGPVELQALFGQHAVLAPQRIRQGRKPSRTKSQILLSGSPRNFNTPNLFQPREVAVTVKPVTALRAKAGLEQTDPVVMMKGSARMVPRPTSANS